MLYLLFLIVPGIYTCLRGEVNVSAKFVIRGRAAQYIGIALITGGLLSFLLPRYCVDNGIIKSLAGEIILGFAVVGASFADIAYVVFGEMRKRGLAKTMVQAPGSAPQAGPAVHDALPKTLVPRSEESEFSPFELICIFLNSGNAKARTAALRMNTALLKTAAAAAQRRRVDSSYDWRADPALAHLPAELPVGWWKDDQAQIVLKQAASLERDRAFLLTCWPDMSGATSALGKAWANQKDQLRAQPTRWTSLSPAQIWTGVVQPPGTTRPAATDTWAVNETRLAELAKLAAVAPAGSDVSDALKLLVCWPNSASATFLLQACTTPTSQLYAAHALAVRTGAEYLNWWEWEAWLRRAASGASESRATAIRLIDEYRPELATIWLREQLGTPNPALETALRVTVAERALQKITPTEFVLRWKHVLTPVEIDRITKTTIPRQVPIASEPEPIPPPMPEAPRILPFQPTPLSSSVTPEPQPASSFEQEVTPIVPLPMEPIEVQPLAQEPVQAQPLLTTPTPIAKGLPPVAPPPLPVAPVETRYAERPKRMVVTPPRESREMPGEDSSPSVWDEHIRPFLAANWYIIAGLLMVVGGASLLAYFTWDKSPLVRYFFLPVLLAGFTGGMAELGLRLLRRHENLRASGSFLLAGAVCLLPVNFMVLSRAGEDPRMSGLVLIALGLYTTMAGLGLWRWCGAVQSKLSVLLGLPLLAVNLLAVIGDMPGVRAVTADYLAWLVPATFTAAVLLMLAVSNRFLRLVLTKELLEGKIVPWFFGITIAATTAQVALWRHFQLHLVPQPQDYALAVILVGATLLRWERRAGQLRNTGASFGGESFLGYAALLLGILMAAGNEWLRIVALLMAGVIWLVQAPRRPGVVHYWIGCTLCMLGGAAVGLLDSFPKNSELNLLPELGLALALVAGAVRALAARRGETRLRDVAREIQPPILIISSIVAVLSQYRFHSAPWQTGLVLVAGALIFAVRATWETRRDWLNIAAVAAGLALPYLGCADVLGYRFEENTLGLGFGLLATAWLTAAHFLRSNIWRRSGSIVATGYGVAGMLGLCLRLTLANCPEFAAADLAGGALLAGVLGVAAWQLRSPGRGLLAAGLPVLILPLFRVPADIMPAWLHVGTGLTSAAAALVLMLGCFRLRRLASTGSKVPPADMETSAQKAAFTFLVPLLAAVFWLIAKALLLQLVQVHRDQMPFLSSVLLASATLYAAAVYFRQNPGGKVLFHASWLLLGAGMAMACDEAGYRDLQLCQFSLLWTGAALTALLAAEWAVTRTQEWATAFLVRPRLQLLAFGSAIVAVPTALAAQVPFFAHREKMGWLSLFLAAQLIWHGLRTSQRRFGAVLFVLAFSWLCDWPGLPASFGHLPVFLLAVLLVDFALEFFEKPRAFVEPLRAPFIAGTTFIALALAVVAALSLQPIGGGALDFVQPRMDLGLICVALLLVARVQVCAGFALAVAALGFLLCLLPCGIDELLRPWRLAEFALLLVLLPFLGRALWARWPRLLHGSKPQLPGSAATPQAPWFAAPGLALAASAAAGQIAISSIGRPDDAPWIQVFAPFAAVFAFSLSGLYWHKRALWVVAKCLLPVANLFAISVLWGQDLLNAHLAPVHIGGIAAVLTVAEFAAARWFVLRSNLHPASRAEAAQWLHYGCVALAGLTLVFLGVDYLANPDLAQIPVARFATSGLLALSVGIYFRFAARRPENLRTPEGVWMESLWHAALGLAIWCAALLIPPLRTPHAAIYALALPAVALWAAAEWFLTIRSRTEENRLTGTRFRANAAVFSMFILALYVFRLPFQMLLFPRARLELDVYHTGAPAMILMGILLIRVRGLGGAPWSALLGGSALMTGLYFGVTWLPGLSPFNFPMAGAWAAVGAAHLFILVSSRRSPLRRLIQRVGGISEEEWHAHRRLWGLYLTAAAHVAVVAGLIQAYGTHSLETTPLLLALASVLIHQAAIGAPQAGAYWGLAVFEILLALHLDFLLPASAPGLIPARDVVWFLLAPWLAAGLGWRHWLEPRIERRHIWSAAIGLAVLCSGHLYYHGPATGSGVLIAALMLVAALLTPFPAVAPDARTGAALMFAGPIWLTYFGTRWLTGDNGGVFAPLLASTTALYALALPAFALWAAAEWFLTISSGTGENRLTGARFRDSAAAFSVLILALYIFRQLFQILLFPMARLELGVYHTGAAEMILMGMLLIRVRGLGGTPWAALLGGLALMTGLYFGATWLPGLSPFDFPMAGAWTAVGAAHLFILVSSRQSPLRSLIQYVGGISEVEWHAHRRLWGLYLTAAAHVAVVAGLIQAYGTHSLETTPLLLALASVLIHQAVIGVPWAGAYWGIAVFEVLLALHLDFLLPASAPGLIPARDVVWFLLAPWLAAGLGWRRWLEPRIECRHIWSAAIGLAVLCSGHLYYHGPATGSGVLIVALMLLAALLTPVRAADPDAQTGAALVFIGPIWLAYFGTRWLTGDNADAFRPLLAGAAAFLGSGLFVRLAGMAGAGTETPDFGVLENQPRAAVDRPDDHGRQLAYEVLALCRRSGETIARGLMIAAFASLTFLTFLHASSVHGSLGVMLALTFVWGVSCVAWFREGSFRDGILPYALSLLSAAGAWIILRRLLFQYFTFWTLEYDTWLSLGASIAFSAAKRLIKHERPGLGQTITGAIWLLPVLQCAWLLYARLGTDLALLIIGVQSMLFAWQGGGKRDSPYNAVSMLGFVGFVCLLFWTKLDLRCVQAYTIPVGLGVLGLVWLFGQHMQPSVRNAVRLTTVLIMLGSCGYYALLDNSYSLGFHLTMLLLCLAMMALGPLLRVQLYLYLGFAGFVTDLAALMVQQFRTLDRSIQMMGVGALLLLLGIVVVGGAIFYKTHYEALRSRFAAVRARMGGWE